MENNTGLNFMNGFYKIEVIEISKPGDQPFVKVNLTTSGLTEMHYIRQNEDPSINREPFNKIKINLTFFTLTVVRLAVEYPDTWSWPEKYNIEKPVADEKISNIELSKSADKIELNKGDVVEIKILVYNTGNGTAHNLTLEEKFPTGFTRASGSIFPPVIQNELEAGGNIELLYALKAMESGSYEIEPTTIKYDSKIAQSNYVSLIVLEEKIEKSNLTTDITLDKNTLFTGETVTVSVKITNNGNKSAESILIDGTLPEGMEVMEGDLRQVYKQIDSGDFQEYAATLKAVEAGNYSIIFQTSYSDDKVGLTSNSDPITVKETQKNYLYILIPAIIIIAVVVLFIMRRHKEYSF